MTFTRKYICKVKDERRVVTRLIQCLWKFNSAKNGRHRRGTLLLLGYDGMRDGLGNVVISVKFATNKPMYMRVIGEAGCVKKFRIYDTRDFSAWERHCKRV